MERIRHTLCLPDRQRPGYPGDTPTGETPGEPAGRTVGRAGHGLLAFPDLFRAGGTGVFLDGPDLPTLGLRFRQGHLIPVHRRESQPGPVGHILLCLGRYVVHPFPQLVGPCRGGSVLPVVLVETAAGFPGLGRRAHRHRISLPSLVIAPAGHRRRRRRQGPRGSTSTRRG